MNISMRHRMEHRVLQWMLVTAFVFSPALIHATLDGAKAAYLRGAAKEKVKDYPGAIAEYRAALVEYPAYVYANKQIANCLYYQGDKAGALTEYDAYLKGNPNDAATRAFADKLRASLGAAPATDAAAKTAAPRTGSPFNPAMYGGLGLGFMMDDGADWKKLFGSTLTIQSGYAYLGDLKFGYQMAGGFALEGSFKYGPVRALNISNPFFTLKFNINQMTLMAEPIYRWRIGESMTIGPGLGIGYGMATMTAVGGTGSASASGLVFLPEVKFQKIGGRWITEVDAGYHMADLSPVKGSTGGNVTDSTGQPWHIQDSGFYMRIGIAYAFSNLLP